MDVSVILTTRDRAPLLQATLMRYLQMDTGGFDWELIVVDNGSSDNTQAVLATVADSLPLKVLYEPVGRKTRAQNIAVAQASGALLVFTDDDSLASPEWLAALHAAAGRWPDDSIFGGAIVPQWPESLPDWIESVADRKWWRGYFAWYCPRADEGYTRVPPIGPNTAIRAALMATVRFDENVGPDGSRDYIKGGDTDLVDLLAARGERFVFVPEARIEHVVRDGQLTLDSLFADAFRRGRKNAYLYPVSGRWVVAGAPLKLWLKVVRQAVRYALARLRGPGACYRQGDKFHYRRGFLFEQRRSASISRQRPRNRIIRPPPR